MYPSSHVTVRLTAVERSLPPSRRAFCALLIHNLYLKHVSASSLTHTTTNIPSQHTTRMAVLRSSKKPAEGMATTSRQRTVPDKSRSGK